jgi:hypothetical protein
VIADRTLRSAANRYDQRDVLPVIGGPILGRYQVSDCDMTFNCVLRVFTYTKFITCASKLARQIPQRSVRMTTQNLLESWGG